MICQIFQFSQAKFSPVVSFQVQLPLTTKGCGKPTVFRIGTCVFYLFHCVVVKRLIILCILDLLLYKAEINTLAHSY